LPPIALKVIFSDNNIKVSILFNFVTLSEKKNGGIYFKMADF